MRKIYCGAWGRPIVPALFLSFFFLRGVAQSQSVLATGYDHPLSVFMDKSGRLFYTNGNTVQIFSSTPFAGTGTAGSSGDGGPATSAQLNQPYGIYEDPDGNVYIGTRGDNKIRKVTTDGTISTFAGNGTAGYSGDGGPAIQASLAGINGLYGDPYGNIYVSDSIHAVVRKIDTTGKITTIAGTGVPGYSGDGGPATAAQLFRPNGIGIDANRNIYIGDDSVNAVRKIDTNGVITTLLGGNPAKGFLDGDPSQVTFSNITSITADDVGDIYIIDNGNQLLRVFSASADQVSGINPAVIEEPGTQPFTSVTVGPTGQPYASDTVDGELWAIGINYFPGADSVSQDIYAPLPGHPLTSYYNAYIVDQLSYFLQFGNRTIALQPTALAPLPPGTLLPSGSYTFVVSMDSFFRFNGIDLSNRHVRIISPPGQDSAQDQITIWFTGQDAINLAGYMTSIGDPDPGFVQYYPVGPEEQYLDLSPLRVLYFHGADNRPGNVTGAVEEIVPSWYEDDGNNPNANPSGEPCSGNPYYNCNSYFAVTFPVSHGLAGNFYFTTGTLGPLPLTLLSFTAAPQGQDAVLNWTTTNEVDTRDFLVQRSQDTTAFATVGTVDAVSTPGNHSYAYTDKALAPGVYYYRLRMEDQRGRYTYSPIRSVTIGGGGIAGFVLYPNPAKDMLYCQVGAAVGGKYVLQLTDVQGKVLQTQEVSLSEGVTTLSFNVSGLAAGVYFITVSDGGSKQTAQFLK
jgi:hypothetical protein